jgi:translocation protein SEC66
VTLLQLDPPVADKVLKAALVARAATNVQRVLQLREDKPALQALLQKGSVGDDLWAALLAAEKELEAEILDVVSEANAYVPGWGQIIFETASQIVANDKMRAMFESTARKRQEAGSCLLIRSDNGCRADGVRQRRYMAPALGPSPPHLSPSPTLHPPRLHRPQ